MAYFLGNKQFGKLKPIELLNENDERIPNKLLDILRFTTQFQSESDLKKYLVKKKLIDNYSTELSYLISKGNKDNRRYEIIYLGDHLYLQETAKFLSIVNIKQFINEKIYTDDFMNHLYAFYLRKFGIFNLAVKRFKAKAYDYFQMVDWLETMLNVHFSPSFKAYLERIYEFINDVYTKEPRNYLYLTREEDLYYQSLIEEINHQILDNDEDIRKFVSFFKSYCRYPDIPTIRHLDKIENVSSYYKTVGEQNIDSIYEVEDVRSYIDRFIDSLIYVYDTKTHDYKKVNGSYKINERNLCDLIMFLSSWEEYLKTYNNQLDSPVVINRQIKKSEETSDDEDDKEEFLEPTDFERQNDDYHDYGYMLRYGDGFDEW